MRRTIAKYIKRVLFGMKAINIIIVLLFISGCGKCPQCNDMEGIHWDILECADHDGYAETQLEKTDCLTFVDDLGKKDGRTIKGRADIEDCTNVYIREMPGHPLDETKTIIHEMAHVETGRTCNENYAVSVAKSFLDAFNDNNCQIILE